MHRRKNHTGAALNEREYLTVAELADYAGVGLISARKLGEDAGAIIRIGKLLRFKRAKVDQYLDTLH